MPINEHDKIVELLNELGDMTAALPEELWPQFTGTMRDLRAAIENALAPKAYVRPHEPTDEEIEDVYEARGPVAGRAMENCRGLRHDESLTDYAKRITRAHADATVEAVRRAKL